MRLMAVGDKSLLRSQRGSECNRLWVLKNSFQGISITKFVRKLLNVRSPQTLEFAEITALVPFSTPTRYFNSYPSSALIRASRKFMHLDNGDVWAHCRGHVVGEPVPSPSVLPFRRLWLSKPYGGLASTSSARNAS